MPGLSFTCTGARPDRYAAGPTLVFRLRVDDTEGRRMHALLLRVQIRIEPRRRRYTDEETAPLADLFGAPARWAHTLNPMQLAQVAVTVPAFTGSTTIDVPVPCTYDTEVASSKYLRALRDGDVPLLLLFSGTAFPGGGGFHVEPVPWSSEARHQMPVTVWNEMIDQHFPNSGWLRIRRDTLDALSRYRARHTHVSWDVTLTELLKRAESAQAPEAEAPPAAGPRPPAGTETEDRQPVVRSEP